MFLISVKCEYENKIKNKLKSLYNKKTTIFTEDDILTSKKYKNYKYVITEYNKEVINYFLNQKKIIIIIGMNNDSLKLVNKNIYYCSNIEEIKEVVKKNGMKSSVSIRITLAIILLIALISILLIHQKNSKKDNSVQNDKKSIINKTTKKQKPNENDYKSQNIVFLGDSITEYYYLPKYYGDLPVVNSGIGGNKAYDILGDMENRVYKYNPTKVFLLVGTNDLFHRTDREIVNNIADIARLIHKHRKNAKVYVESIYPINNETKGNDIVIDWMVSTRDNERIKSINKQIEENSVDYDYTYLDFYNLLADKDGMLKLEYTVDGLHISDEGYKLITKEIMKIIEGEENE